MRGSENSVRVFLRAERTGRYSGFGFRILGLKGSLAEGLIDDQARRHGHVQGVDLGCHGDRQGAVGLCLPFFRKPAPFLAEQKGCRLGEVNLPERGDGRMRPRPKSGIPGSATPEESFPAKGKSEREGGKSSPRKPSDFGAVRIDRPGSQNESGAPPRFQDAKDRPQVPGVLKVVETQNRALSGSTSFQVHSRFLRTARIP